MTRPLFAACFGLLLAGVASPGQALQDAGDAASPPAAPAAQPAPSAPAALTPNLQAGKQLSTLR